METNNNYLISVTPLNYVSGESNLKILNGEMNVVKSEGQPKLRYHIFEWTHYRKIRNS